MFLMPILLVIQFVWLITGRHHHEAPYNGRQAIDIVKERYARGEITKEQYDQMKKDLS
jgi:putative membrane protein